MLLKERMKRIFFVGIVAFLLLVCVISCNLFEGSDRDTIRTHLSARINGKEVHFPVEISKINKVVDNNTKRGGYLQNSRPMSSMY